MKLNNQCTLRRIAGENIIIRPGSTEIDLTQVVSLNATAAWLWEQLAAREFTVKEAVTLLTTHYNVDTPHATADVKAWIDLLQQNNLIEP